MTDLNRDSNQNLVFSGILLRPLAMENREGEVVCLPRGTQLSVTLSESYSDIAPEDVKEAVELGNQLSCLT